MFRGRGCMEEDWSEAAAVRKVVESRMDRFVGRMAEAVPGGLSWSVF